MLMAKPHEYLFAGFLAVLVLACTIYALAQIKPDGPCLIYGIDFNGRNEPFGLFC